MAIPENELRLLNWVYHYGESAQILHLYQNAPVYGDTIKPIQINSEILEKCGFKKDNDGIYVLKGCLYWLEEGILQIALNYTPLFNAPCKFVHQLQNLYFALTGEELEINL